jgi:hypothetical protein
VTRREQTLAEDRSPVLNVEEQKAMTCLYDFMQIVNVAWALDTNKGELAAAVHVLQGFVIQHMLRRLASAHWSAWYASQRGKA